MAIKQGVAAAAIAYGFELAAGYNPTIAKAAVAGLSGVADYYSKASLFPMLNLKIDGYPAMAAGAAAGGVSYAAALSYVAGIGDTTSSFLRGAMYAIASDIVLGYISPEFEFNKVLKAVGSQIFRNEQKLEKMEYEPSAL